MSDLPARREQVVFPNPGVSIVKWCFDNHSRLGKFAPFLPLIGGALGAGVVLAALVINNVSIRGIEEPGILLGIGFWPGLLLFAGIWKLIVDSITRQKRKYRREHAHLFIEALGAQGWTAYGDDPVQQLVEEDYPYFYKGEFRYKTYNKVIDDKSVEWNFVLDDATAEALYRDDEKARRIEHLTAEYEKANGPLSPEAKDIFQSALKMDTGK